MEANTLRIGNLLQDQFGNLLKVIELTEKSIVTSVIDRSKYPLPDGWKAQPIPLSEDILLKLGFEKDEYDIERPMYYTFKGFRLNCNVGFLTLNNSNELADFKPIELKFLHQIQNLFHSLTGEELTIKE